jgi:Delta14-sterol reductase
MVRVYFCSSKSLLTLNAAFATFLLAMGAVVGVIVRKGEGFFADWVYEKWIGLLTASVVMATLQCIYVYAASFGGQKLLALGGNSGNFIYDVRSTFLITLNNL